MNPHHNLAISIDYCKRRLINVGQRVESPMWHAVENKVPMVEVLNTSFQAPIPEEIPHLRELIEPNLPWADVHFAERVCGIPLNPGESYKQWPFYKRDKEMRTEGEKFTHTYMERFWPKNAWDAEDRPANGKHIGIRYEYGDLMDVLNLLENQPMTRQAYLPIWFPEDTGGKHGRIPCSIGYHFIIRNGHIHLTYQMRSCDFMRHFRDDIYLACRMLLWVIDILNTRLPEKLKPGMLTMHITSLHLFEHELKLLKK